MKRTRCAAYIEINGGVAFMHRNHVKPTPDKPNKPYGEYYVFPGGGLEEGETVEEATVREVLEEFGITVEVEKVLYFKEIHEELDEYIMKCKYVSGEFGTGSGPEFSNDPAYKDRGTYEPVIIKKEDIKNIRLIPEDLKNMLVKDIEEGNL